MYIFTVGDKTFRRGRIGQARYYARQLRKRGETFDVTFGGADVTAEILSPVAMGRTPGTGHTVRWIACGRRRAVKTRSKRAADRFAARLLREGYQVHHGGAWMQVAPRSKAIIDFVRAARELGRGSRAEIIRRAGYTTGGRSYPLLDRAYAIGALVPAGYGPLGTLAFSANEAWAERFIPTGDTP